jgi:hypothetical protein
MKVRSERGYKILSHREDRPEVSITQCSTNLFEKLILCLLVGEIKGHYFLELIEDDYLRRVIARTWPVLGKIVL